MIYNNSTIARWASTFGQPIWVRTSELVVPALQAEMDEITGDIHPVCAKVLNGLLSKAEMAESGVYIGVGLFAYQVFHKVGNKLKPVGDMEFEEYRRKVNDADSVSVNPDGVKFDLFFDASDNAIAGVELVKSLYALVDYKTRAYGIFGTDARSIITAFVNSYNIGV